MSFINVALAAGALAFSIPLLIHLLNRSKFTTVDWGAWHLLDSVIRTNQRRLQITNLLLLLLRCLIPVILAFCLARPVLTGFKSLPGDAPRSLVVAIDDSRSMLAAPSGRQSRFQRLKDQLRELLGTMTRRDEIILVTAGDVDSPAVTTGVGDAVEKVGAMQANSGPVDLGRLLNAAVDAAQQAVHQQRSIVVLSDFQSANIGNGTVATLQEIAKRTADSDFEPTISFLNFADESDVLPNVSVDSVVVNSPAVVAGRNAQLSARIRNSSENPARDLRVIWTIDGVALAPRLASVEARATTTARLSHRIEEPGVHEVAVSVEFADSLAADNRRSIGVDVMREVNVAIVDGRPSSRPLEGQADFLSIALSPFAFGGDDQPDSVKASVIREGQIREAIDKARPEILVLANVGTVDDANKKAIASYVLEGGSLIVFDGDAVKAADFNQPWQSGDGDLVFPGLLGEVVPAESETKDSESSLRLGEINNQYSAWAMLAPGDQRPLSQVEVRSFRKLEVVEPKVDEDGNQIVDESSALVLLRTSEGDPIVVAAGRGKGQVIQFGVPCDASWTSLPLRMVYLPMMQQMILDLAGRRRVTTTGVGQPIAVPIQEFDAFESVAAAKKARTKLSFTVESPDGSEVSLVPGEDDAKDLIWTQTKAAGTYHFRQHIQTDERRENPNDSEDQAKTLRVVQVPEEESQLRALSADRLESIAGTVNAKIYSSLNQLQSDDRTRRFGREIWRWLLGLLLVGMIGELFLQQQLIGRQAGRGNA